MRAYFIKVTLLFGTAMILGACSSSDEEQASLQVQCQVTGIASKMSGEVVDIMDFGDATTRSMYIGGSNGNRFFQGWDVYDEPKVVKNGAVVGSMTPTATGVEVTTLSGTLSGSFNVGDELQLYSSYPVCRFDNQEGSIAGLSKDFSHLAATTTVTNVSGTTVTTAEMQFSTVAMYFLFVPRDQNNMLIDVKRMTIHCEEGSFVETWNFETGEKTYTEDIVITPELVSPVNSYPTTVYVSLCYTGRPVCIFTIETGDGKIYQRTGGSLKFTTFNATNAMRVNLPCTCINVDAGVSTSITPPSDEDVVIDDVTKD